MFLGYFETNQLRYGACSGSDKLKISKIEKMNALILTDDSNSNTVKIANKSKFLPLVSNTVLSSSDLIKHHSIDAIIIDKIHRNADSLEFILNARELNCKSPIFVVKSKANENSINEIELNNLNVNVIEEENLLNNLTRLKTKIQKLNKNEK